MLFLKLETKNSKKMRFYLLFLFVFLFTSIDCIESDDFCRKGFMEKCKGYDCGTIFCSSTKETCTKLVSYRNVMKTKSVHKFKAYQKFVDSIKYCKKHGQNEWSQWF